MCSESTLEHLPRVPEALEFYGVIVRVLDKEGLVLPASVQQENALFNGLSLCLCEFRKKAIPVFLSQDDPKMKRREDLSLKVVVRIVEIELFALGEGHLVTEEVDVEPVARASTDAGAESRCIEGPCLFDVLARQGYVEARAHDLIVILFVRVLKIIIVKIRIYRIGIVFLILIEVLDACGQAFADLDQVDRVLRAHLDRFDHLVLGILEADDVFAVITVGKLLNQHVQKFVGQFFVVDNHSSHR